MAIINDIAGASYAGISFPVRTTQTTGGRKDVLHSFPNSNKQLIEDLGLQPRDYSLTAIINETANIPYLLKRDQLLAALERGNAEDLVHPFYGLISNVVARSFIIREDLTSLGDSEIDIEFAISDITGQSTIRALSGFSASVLGSTRSNVALNIITAIANFFIVRGSAGGNIDDAQNILGEFINIIEEGIVTSPVDISLLDSFSRKLTNFEDSIPALVFNPTELGRAISIIIEDFAGLYPEASDKVDIMEDLFNFGINDVPIVEDTSARIQRKINRDVINNSINTLALSESYVAASQIDFSNIRELNELEDRLERQYRFIINQTVNIDQNVLNELQVLRTQTQDFFDMQKLTVRQIINVKTNETTARLLSYQYYGNSQFGKDIIKLNSILDVSNISGNIDILTE